MKTQPLLFASILGASLLAAAQGCTTCVGSSDVSRGKSQPARTSRSALSRERSRTHTLKVADKDRRYFVQTPAGYDRGKGKKSPLIVMFPGDGRGPEDFSDRTHILEGSAKLGYVLAVPAAAKRWSPGICDPRAAATDAGVDVPDSGAVDRARKTGDAASPRVRAASGDAASRGADATSPDGDIEFVRQMIAQLNKEYRVDPGRIYAMGVGAGAAFAERLAADAVVGIAAVVSVAASPCDRSAAPAPVKPVTALIIDSSPHPTALGGAGESAASAIGYWMRGNDCSVRARRGSAEAEIVCKSTARTKHVTVAGLKNEWPAKIGKKYTLRYVHEFIAGS